MKASVEPLLTEAEIAEVLQVPKDTLKTWRSRGGGPPFIRVNGRLIRYRRAALAAWLAEQEVAA